MPRRSGPLKVGDAAPDFTVTTVTAAGITSKPFRLSEHKGETVILAFFPKARTRGCTVQMESYRDRYAELFKSGEKVTLVGVSVDPDSALTSWAKDAKFPFQFAADVDHKVGVAYAASTGEGFHKRLLYVINPQGKISYVAAPFTRCRPTPTPNSDRRSPWPATGTERHLPVTSSRALLSALHAAAVQGAAPFLRTRQAVDQWLDVHTAGPDTADAPIHVFALGKAAWAMAEGACAALEARGLSVTGGIVVSNHLPDAAHPGDFAALPEVLRRCLGDHPVRSGVLEAADAIDDAIGDIAGSTGAGAAPGGTTALCAAPIPALAGRR